MKQSGTIKELRESIYIVDSKFIDRFLGDNYDEIDGGYVTVKSLWAHIREAVTNSIISQKSLSRRMQERGYKKHRLYDGKKQIRCYLGLMRKGEEA